MRVVLSLALLILGMPRVAEACSCLQTSVCRSVTQADTIFEGTVESIELSPRDDAGGGLLSSLLRQRVVRFRDLRSWKGDTPAFVTTGSGGGDCGYDFQIGRRYVVAGNHAADGVVSTGIFRA
jgi:hypothetical protein